MGPDRPACSSYGASPAWAERAMPRTAILSDLPGLLLLRVPDEDFWLVASRAATDVVADPASPLGRLLRAHCGLIGLRYLSNN